MAGHPNDAPLEAIGEAVENKEALVTPNQVVRNAKVPGKSLVYVAPISFNERLESRCSSSSNRRSIPSRTYVSPKFIRLEPEEA